MKTQILIAASITLCWNVPTACQAVNVEPDDFPNGTNISNAFPGVTLSDITGGGGAVNPVLSLTSPVASTGTRVFGRFDQQTSWGNGSWDFLRIDITGATSSASLDFIADDSDSNPVLAAYNSAGILLTSSTLPGTFAVGTVVPLTVSAPNIATVLALGDPPPGSFGTIAQITAITSGGPNNWVVDNFRYERVPEPATIALVALGTLAATAWRRRRS